MSREVSGETGVSNWSLVRDQDSTFCLRLSRSKSCGLMPPFFFVHPLNPILSAVQISVSPCTGKNMGNQALSYPLSCSTSWAYTVSLHLYSIFLEEKKIDWPNVNQCVCLGQIHSKQGKKKKSLFPIVRMKKVRANSKEDTCWGKLTLAAVASLSHTIIFFFALLTVITFHRVGFSFHNVFFSWFFF